MTGKKVKRNKKLYAVSSLSKSEAIIKLAADAFDRMRNLWIVISIMFLDLLFLLIYNSSESYFASRIQEKAYNIIQIVTSGSKSIGESLTSSSNLLGALQSQSGFQSEYNAIVYLFVLSAMAAYVIYVIIEGAAWSITSRQFSQYYPKFIIINILWSGLYFGISAIERGYRFIILSNTKSPADTTIFTVIKILIVVLAFISYGLLQKSSVWSSIKKSVVLSFTKTEPLLAALLILVVGGVVEVIMTLALRISTYAVIISGIAILLPAAVWTRIFIMNVGAYLHKIYIAKI